MPKIAAVAESFKDRGVVLYAVNIEEEPETVEKFLEDRNLKLTVALDTDAEVSELFHVVGIPQTVLIGRDGRVQAVHRGLPPDLEQILTKQLEALVAGEDLAAEVLWAEGQ
jgi:peroxiredoxin